jgi:phage N-6-adenine-methyltransferase
MKQRADGRDEWQTPDYVYEDICDYWQLQPTIDVFASAENSKCPLFITEEMDAFKLDWVEFARANGVAPIFWVQPPWSRPILTEAIKRTIEMAKKGGESLFLLPSWVDRSWYLDLIYGKYEHTFWRDPNIKEGQQCHRIKFIPKGSIKPSSPMDGNIHGVIRMFEHMQKMRGRVQQGTPVWACSLVGPKRERSRTSGSDSL